MLLDEHGHAYLADFGLTRRLTDQAPRFRPGLSLGTAAYVAPEQIRGDEVDDRADQYSLACMLYECLTGKPPFRRGTEAATLYAHLEEAPPAPSGLGSVIPRALSKDPADRYPTCRELIADARDALGLEPKRSHWPLAVAVVGAALLGAALVAFFLTRGTGAVPPEPGADTLVRIDPRTNKVVDTMPVGRLAGSVAADSRYVWVTSTGDGTVWRIDAKTGSVLKLAAHGTPTAVALGGGKAILADAPEHKIVSLDAATGAASRLSPRSAVAFGATSQSPRARRASGSPTRSAEEAPDSSRRSTTSLRAAPRALRSRSPATRRPSSPRTSSSTASLPGTVRSGSQETLRSGSSGVSIRRRTGSPR